MKAQVKTEKEVKTVQPDHELFEPGEVGAVLELIVKKKDGTVRERREMKSKSFVRQFFDILLGQMKQIPELGPVRILDTSNEERELAFAGINFACEALVTDDTYGIVAGTGTTAPTISDYALETQIADGVGAGELQYGDVAFGVPASNATFSHFTVTRDFSNASGAQITVNEIGLYVKVLRGSMYVAVGGGRDITSIHMTIRDVIAGGIDIPNGETLTVNYRQQATA